MNADNQETRITRMDADNQETRIARMSADIFYALAISMYLSAFICVHLRFKIRPPGRNKKNLRSLLFRNPSP